MVVQDIRIKFHFSSRITRNWVGRYCTGTEITFSSSVWRKMILRHFYHSKKIWKITKKNLLLLFCIWNCSFIYHLIERIWMEVKLVEFINSILSCWEFLLWVILLSLRIKKTLSSSIWMMDGKYWQFVVIVNISIHSVSLSMIKITFYDKFCSCNSWNST